MYVCGMTVYDYCHIGHARVMVAFDYIIRFLRSQGWKVRYIRNITDIDDKIIARANENGESIQQLTARFIDAMNEDAANLGCAAPDEAPKATEYIDQMQNMITLVDKGAAYPAANGDVYFEVTKFDKYGRLSGRKLDDMQAGASERVDVEVDKKHLLTLYFGNMPKKMNLLGHHLGAMVAQVGILNALQCRLAA
jgi:cysteinyl-tRNA synthetase